MLKKFFHNPYEGHIKRALFEFLLWQIGYYKDSHTLIPVPEGFSFPIPKKPLDKSAPTATWINHSTYLIQIEGLHILTDPIWSERCSPVSFLGPKRHHAPPLQLHELPRIDFVLISHDHYDHLDKRSVRTLHKLFPNIVWFVPTGVKEWFKRQGIEKVIERGWWQEAKLVHGSMKLTATAVPTQHFSGRISTNLNNTLWAGWVVDFEHEVKGAKRLYFVGDTGYNPVDFRDIGKKWKKMDLSLIPIGSYMPRKFMSPVHIEPADAVRIHQDVGSKKSLAMHWKTFCLSDEPMNQPPYDLFLALEKAEIDPATFLAIEPGHAINW